MTSRLRLFKEFFMKSLLSILIVVLLGLLSKDFSLDSIWILLAMGSLIGLEDFLLQNYTNLRERTLLRGLVGFFISFFILFIGINSLAGVNISYLGMAIGSLLIGLIDIIIPGIEL